MKKYDRYLLTGLEVAYGCIFLITPLVFTWFNEELFEFNKMMVVYALTAVIAALWLMRCLFAEKFEWKKTFFDFPLAIFIGSQLISTLLSIHLRTSIFGYYSRFHGGLLSTLSYSLLFAAFTQNFSRDHIWRFLRTLAIGSILVSIVAIPEHFGHSLSCVFINSSQLAQASPLSEVLQPAQLLRSYNTSCWIQDVQNRVFATFGQPNWLAAFAITLLPVFFILAATRKKEHFLYTITALALFTTLLFTRSRSGLLGCVVGLGWFMICTLIWFLRSSQGKNKVGVLRQHFQEKSRVFLPLFSLFIGCLALAAIFGTPYTKPLFSSATPPTAMIAPTQPVNRLENEITDSGDIRKIVWAGAIKIWQRYPIFGSGVETFAYSYFTDRPMAHNNVTEWDFLYNKAHNEFLNFLATTGIVGLTSYIIFLGAAIEVPIYFASKKKDLELEQALLLISFSTGLVSLTVSNALGFSTVMVGVLLFLYPAFTWILEKAELKTGVKTNLAILPEDHAPTYRPWIWSAVTALALCVVLGLIWRAWSADYLLAKSRQLQQSQHFSEALDNLEKAYRLSGGEGVFTERLAETYSWLSASFADAQQATAAAYYREEAKAKADELLIENPHDLNFYKTKTRILATLAPQDPTLLIAAIKTLDQAAELAPTDPKVRYNHGLLMLSLSDTSHAQADFEQSIAMKPNYEEARISLAKILIQDKKWNEALDQYKYIVEKIQPQNTIAQHGILDLQQIIATASASKSAQPKQK